MRLPARMPARNSFDSLNWPMLRAYPLLAAQSNYGLGDLSENENK